MLASVPVQCKHFYIFQDKPFFIGICIAFGVWHCKHAFTHLYFMIVKSHPGVPHLLYHIFTAFARSMTEGNVFNRVCDFVHRGSLSQDALWQGPVPFLRKYQPLRTSQKEGSPSEPIPGKDQAGKTNQNEGSSSLALDPLPAKTRLERLVRKNQPERRTHTNLSLPDKPRPTHLLQRLRVWWHRGHGATRLQPEGCLLGMKNYLNCIRDVYNTTIRQLGRWKRRHKQWFVVPPVGFARCDATVGFRGDDWRHVVWFERTGGKECVRAPPELYVLNRTRKRQTSN